jgi:hypothetical protein
MGETDLAHERTLDRDAQQHGRTLKRDEQQHERRRGLLRDKADLKAAEDESGLSASDQRALNAAVKRETSGKGSYEGEQTDWEAVAKRLRSVGREDLARYVESQEATGTKSVDVESREYVEAKGMAEEWANNKARILRSDKADFPEYGGSRTEAIRQKTLEYYRDFAGQGGDAPASRPSAASEPAASSQTAGSGTESDPFKPTTQAEFDAVPKGGIFFNPADGKLYRKD